MLEFGMLSLRNFLSYGNNTTIFDLRRPGTTLIVGENLDNTSDGSGANGVGKAQPLHCKVKIPGGWTTIGDIKVGDLITTPDGGQAHVGGVYPQGSRPTYRVTFSDGRTTEADEDHLWTVFSHRWGNQSTRGRKTLTTIELIQYVDQANSRRKAWYNVFVPTIDHECNDDVPLPLDPYLLGCMLGDGSMTTRHLVFTNKDKECITLVNEALNDIGQELISYDDSINYSIRSNNDTHQNSLADILESMKLIGCNSYTKFIPNEYKNASKRQKLALLQGLLDTDGTVGKTRNVSFSSSSEQLALDVQYLIRSIGGKATKTIRCPHFYVDGVRKRGADHYNISIDYSTPKQLFRLSRKLSKLGDNQTQYANAGLRITSIEYIGNQETQCIMVDHPDHLYITDDFIVTHNTTIVNAIAYALYDKPVSDISKDNLVNNINNKNMEVTLEYVGDDGVQYKIHRFRKMKAGAEGNGVHFYKDGKDITPDSVAATNAEIEKTIGIPYELFVRIIVFSASHNPFLSLKTEEQKSIIEELFGLTAISQKAELLKKQIKDTEGRISIQQVKIDSAEGERTRHTGQIESAKRRVDNWAAQNKMTIDGLNEKLSKIEGVDFDVQQELHNTLASTQKRLNEALDMQRMSDRAIRELAKRRTKLEDDLSHLTDAKCPYCLQHYADANAKVDETKKIMAEIDDELDTLDNELEVISREVATTSQAIKDIKSKIVVDDIEELLTVKNESDNIRRKIKELENETNPFLDPLQELLDMKLDEVDYTDINKLSKEMEHQKFLLKLLTKKDSFIRKALLNKNLPLLNTKLQHYINMLGLPHRVEFTKEMSSTISQFGRSLNFGNLSQGQRARVNFALSMAFRDVLQNLHPKINICMLDEVLDFGLDSIGVVAAAKLVKQKARDENVCMYVISHRDEVSSIFDKRMVIQMSKGFSYVVDEMVR